MAPTGSLLLCYELGQSPSYTNKVLSRWDLSTLFRSSTWLDSRKEGVRDHKVVYIRGKSHGKG